MPADTHPRTPADGTPTAAGAPADGEGTSRARTPESEATNPAAQPDAAASGDIAADSKPGAQPGAPASPLPGRLSGAVPSIVVHRPGSTHHVAKASRVLSAPLPRAPAVDEAEEPLASVTLGERPGQPPWARMALALAICGPALWLGGVPVVVVPVFLGVTLLLWLRLCLRSPGPIRVPHGSIIGLIAATMTLLQWLPLPRALREWLAPDLVAMSTAALAGSGVGPWAGVSPVPGDTAVEAARLFGLTALYVAAAQLSWR
ncbi:MAG TPA: hypothetical protein VGB85_08975, partial [Nannocystis sp.]